MAVQSIITVAYAILYVLAPSNAKSIAKDDEIEVKLQFAEYELEDFCIAKNDAEWNFLNGTNNSLEKLLAVELKESEFYKNELEMLQKHMSKNISNERVQRLVDIFSHPGALLLGNAEFKEYRDYSIKLVDMLGTMKIENPYDTNATESDGGNGDDNNTGNGVNYNDLNKILYSEKDSDKLKQVWINWYEEVARQNKKTKYDFVQQLSILDLEAEQNGEEQLSDYWLKVTDTTWVNYDTAKDLLEEILPLYNKLRHFMTSLAIQNFGRNALHDNKLIPAHVLGSLQSHDWVTAAEKLGAFDRLDVYQEVTSFLSHKSVEELYRLADNLTEEHNLGQLPRTFYERSLFNGTGDHCRNNLNNYCEKDNVPRVMSCPGENLRLANYLRVVENVMRVKYLLTCSSDEGNGYLFREGPRHSALYEAIESMSSLNALKPTNLKNQGILSSSSSGPEVEDKQKIFSLIVSALHIIPRLPYYLAGDLWRINALQEIDSAVADSGAETTQQPSVSQGTNGTGTPYDPAKTYDAANLTADWWKYRAEYQGVGSPDGNLYEDYLQDLTIVWNAPYLSKFLGKLLQFQILEAVENGHLSDHQVNLTRSLMLKGKSKSWQSLVESTFNITEISAQPLLRYFKPLEEYLDSGIKFNNDTQIFSTDDFVFVPQSYSFNAKSSESDEEPGESSDALLFSLAVIAAVGVVATIVTLGRRRYKKRMRIMERKRRLAEL